MLLHTADWRARAERAADGYQELAQRRPLLGLPMAFATRYAARQGVLLASAVAFRMFLTLLPLTLLVSGILAGLSTNNSQTPQSATKAAGISGAAGQQILDALRSGHRSWWIAVVAGAAGFVWTTRTFTRTLLAVSGHLWQVRPQRQRGKQPLVTVAVVGLVFVGLAVVGAGLPHLLRNLPGGDLLCILLEALVASALWVLVSLRLPDGRRTWTDLIPGAVMLGAAVAVAHAASRIYLPRKIEHASQLYGALGIAAVMLGWFLLIGQIVIASGLVNLVWLEYREGGTTHPTAADDSKRLESGVLSAPGLADDDRDLA